MAVGDLMLGDSPTAVGYGFRSRYGDQEINRALTELGPVFSEADLVVGNLEVMLPAQPFDHRNRKAAQMRGHPQYAVSLKQVGFDVLNVANNHADQHGHTAFFETVGHLEQAGIRCCGVRSQNSDWCSQPVVVSRASLDVGILGYSMRPPQYGPVQPPYAFASAADIRRDIQRLKEVTDHVLVSLHWGEEFVSVPSVNEVQTGRSLIEAGATAVFGHHPHVLRSVECWGEGVIAYSLGNLVSDMVWQPQLRNGVIVEVEFDGDRVRHVSQRSTEVQLDYSVHVTQRAIPLDRKSAVVVGLGEAEYRTAVKTSLNQYRRAAYLHALKLIPKTPPRILVQLLTQTVFNKMRAAFSRRYKNG